jgi:hypothetical protein
MFFLPLDLLQGVFVLALASRALALKHNRYLSCHARHEVPKHTARLFEALEANTSRSSSRPPSLFSVCCFQHLVCYYEFSFFDFTELVHSGVGVLEPR